ncbi:MAG: UvrD-helicase domain-containing protein [Synergistaceae bacterium]|nr:UvrD-helicase domain-containing protein [Synergistaceae bacterium]
MTDEEKQQVQNLITARTKLLTEKSARQDEEIRSLSATIISLSNTLESRENEIESLSEKLSQVQEELSRSQEQNRKLAALVQSDQKKPELPVIPQKPSYLLSLLRQHFGFDNFRPGQEEIIDAILSGRDVFCSMPENYGKSVCYRLPALLMPGVTLAVTPDEPEASLITPHSEILTASLTPSKKREILRKVRNGTCKILYATVQQLSEADTLSALRKSEISMAAIISHWGTPHSLEAWPDTVSSIASRRITAGVFADTTSPALRQELHKLAGLHSPLKVVAGFRRDNQEIRIIRAENKPSALKEILSQKKGIPGVIYCSTPETAYKLGEMLRDFDGLNDSLLIMPMLLYREIRRDDIRFTVHYDMPDSLGSFSQQTAITGSNPKSEAIILVSRNDLRNAERTLVSFFRSESPGDFMLSYLGADESITPAKTETENDESAKISPDDVSDFDFGNANEAQREAITATSGPLLIIAGPGTGKTFTLVQRTVFLIQKKRVKPENIMLATFTDKAANEIVTRVAQELSRRNITADTGTMYAGTFHAICERILKEYSDFTGRPKNFRVLDDFGHAYIIMQNMKKFAEIPGLSSALKSQGKWASSRELRDCINTLSEELADPEELMRDNDPAVNALGQAMKIHDEILRNTNSLSWSALLVETYRLLRDNPEILADLQSRVKYIMADEYQDTNYVQEQLALLIAGDTRNICAAGDDDQSIYRFRGAEVRNILEFPGRFGNECRVVRLMLNYRSRPGIIDFFTQWMNDTGKFFAWENFRHEKKLEAYRPAMKNNPSVMRLAGIADKSEWHEKIFHLINALKESGKLTDYSQVAFLFRSVKTPDVKALSQYLEEHNIGVYSPRSNMFFQRREIQFALGCIAAMFPEYLKALESGAFSYNGSEPEYISYYRTCLSYVKRYIDRPQYSGLKKHILSRRNHHARLTGYTGYTFSDLLYELFAYPPFVQALDADISGTVKELRPSRNLSHLIQVLRHYEHSYNINNLHGKYIAGQFQMMMNIYLRFMIEEGADEYESEEDVIPSGHVAFMTIHQAKGMEFPVVFADSLWTSPQDDSGSEIMRCISRKYYRRPEFEPQERVKYFDFWRLYYTAFTRAQDLLILTCCEDRNTPSRYFEDSYNRLDDADESLRIPETEISPVRVSGLKNTYSFTGDILTYETCPTQYKFFRELEFTPGRSANTFTGTLIHAVLEDIHRAVINHEENRITPGNIASWFTEEYEYLSRTEQEYLSQSARKTVLAQIMRYVQRQGDDWSAIRRAEYEVNIVRGEYILEGKIDLISIRDGETEITDFKSGPKPNININADRERLESCRRQVFAYACMAGEATGLKVSRMKLYYTGEESSNPEIVYQYDADEAERIMKGFDDTVSRISRKDFADKAPNPESCRECVFRYYCGRQ